MRKRWKKKAWWGKKRKREEESQCGVSKYGKNGAKKRSKTSAAVLQLKY